MLVELAPAKETEDAESAQKSHAPDGRGAADGGEERRHRYSNHHKVEDIPGVPVFNLKERAECRPVGKVSILEPVNWTSLALPCVLVFSRTPAHLPSKPSPEIMRPTTCAFLAGKTDGREKGEKTTSIHEVRKKQSDRDRDKETDGRRDIQINLQNSMNQCAARLMTSSIRNKMVNALSILHGSQCRVLRSWHHPAVLLHN